MSIRNAEEFSIAFATAVTEASDNPQHWIPKKGTDSVFAVLNEIFPQASKLCRIVRFYQFLGSIQGFRSLETTISWGIIILSDLIHYRSRILNTKICDSVSIKLDRFWYDRF
jgi:hypothetical protein